MPHFPRQLAPQLKRAARSFPSLVLSGPRRAGKTYLLRAQFPRASYHLLEDPDVIARVRADPRGWIQEVRTPAILDEIQNVPEILPYVRTEIDRSPSRMGRWMLTGSQDFSLMQGVSESMAGRAAVFQLLPLSVAEIGRVQPFLGGFPEVVTRPARARDWFRSYIQTYLERDVRALLSVRDLATFRRFLSLLATRHGQILNKTDLASPLGVSVPTITSWLDVLEITGQVQLVQPYFENLGKRLIKSPKLYWIDSGLVCHLLGFETRAALEKSPFAGAVFEGFVASELVKGQVNSGRRRELYFFRDQQGLEVDFLLPTPAGGLCLIEVKRTKTVEPSAARAMQALMQRLPRRATEGWVLTPSSAGTTATALAPHVRTASIDGFLRGA